VYQPIVDLASGRVTGYEGLVRLPRQSTFAHTGALFDAAEAAGRVHDLDRAALDVVLRGGHTLDDSMTLSVNVSPRTLGAPEFSATTFLSLLRRHGMAPAHVVLELTEREAIRDPDRLRAVLTDLQTAGVQVAADDVGAGNAGLQLLSQLRFDVVKIDLSLVQRAGDDRTHSVLRSIVEVAERMGARTIAEGVETSAQLRTARRLGISAGQGYLLGRPGAERDLTWVDIVALEQRDDIAIPVGAEPSQRPTLAARLGAFPDPNVEAERVLEAAAIESGAIAAMRRRSLALLATARQASD
jgi:EAL domain-containing protein (putative c-di-GMP-specific phosphodiesterase class I)